MATGLATDVALPAVAVAVETLDARPRGPAEAAESPNELREVGNTCGWDRSERGGVGMRRMYQYVSMELL